VTNTKPKILCVGVYLADQKNSARHIANILSRSKAVSIEQRWIAISRTGAPSDLRGTVSAVREYTPRCVLINQLLYGFENYDWVIITDDDIEMAEGFADALIGVANYADFALLQPARTHDSYISHDFVAQFKGLVARRTRFIEIGPLVAMRRDAARLILPFADNAEMGWGFDYIWPRRVEKAGMRVGIIDAVPIAHRIREPVSGYNFENAKGEMRRLLAANAHYSPREAFKILEIFA